MTRARSLLVIFGLVGCVSPGNPSQRLAESAYDMNTATRFGRMDVALEHVGAKVRDDWVKKHLAWGKSLRIVDLEFGGLNFKDKGAEAEVFVTVTWQKLDDADVRVTGVTQRWEDNRGTWALVEEEEREGDGGLLVKPGKAKEAAATEPLARPAPSYRMHSIPEAEGL